MTPAEVRDLTVAEWNAMATYQNKVTKERQKASRERRR